MAVPEVGTDICGFPLDGVSESFTASHVQIEGCRLKSVNHSQAVSSSGSTSASVRILPLTPHLHCPVIAEQSFRGYCLLGRALDPDAVLAVTEARVVSDHHRQPRDPGMDEKPGDGGKRSDENHHFEAEDGVRNPRRDWLPADHKRPVVRRPDRDPVAERHAAQTTDQRVAPHRTRRRLDRRLELVTRGRREDADGADALVLERFDRADGRVEITERAEYAAHQAYSPGVSASYSKCLPPGSMPCGCTFPRRGGTISFTSAIAITGSCLMNSRNHIENQPKLPQRMA